MDYTKTVWKDYPDTTTKMTAQKLNNIENGIEDLDTRLTTAEGKIDNLDNVTKYITATAGSNGDFKVNIPNTLETGMIVNITFPTAVNPSANVQVSVDGGTTYYNLLRESDGRNVLVKYVANQYAEIYFNGTAFIFKENISKVLYNGSSNANITLNETIENFNYIEIFYSSNGGGYNSVKIYSPQGKQAYLITNAVNAGISYFQNKLVNLSGISITNAVYNENSVGTGTTNTVNGNNNSITRVVGYR